MPLVQALLVQVGWVDKCAVFFCRFRFTAFSLEAASRCQYDYVAIYDGDSVSSPLIGRYCGTTVPDVVKSTSNKMLVNFVTDSSLTSDGFSAGYWSTYGQWSHRQANTPTPVSYTHLTLPTIVGV